MTDEDNKQPSPFDYYMATKYPFLAHSGVLGKGAQKAWEEIAPMFGIVAIVAAIVLVVAGILAKLGIISPQ